jgi:hypothetical protein
MCWNLFDHKPRGHCLSQPKLLISAQIDQSKGELPKRRCTYKKKPIGEYKKEAGGRLNQVFPRFPFVTEPQLMNRTCTRGGGIQVLTHSIICVFAYPGRINDSVTVCHKLEIGGHSFYGDMRGRRNRWGWPTNTVLIFFFWNTMKFLLCEYLQAMIIGRENGKEYM